MALVAHQSFIGPLLIHELVFRTLVFPTPLGWLRLGVVDCRVTRGRLPLPEVTTPVDLVGLCDGM